MNLLAALFLLPIALVAASIFTSLFGFENEDVMVAVLLISTLIVLIVIWRWLQGG